MSRRLARETALQVLFQLDVAGDASDITNVVRHWAEEFAVPESSIPFAQELVEGTLAHLEEIDTRLAQLSEGWALTRMAKVDRNLLRLACYEIIFRVEIPGRVTINEALEIAKRYGSDESGKFINGILDRVIESANKKEEKK
jgi:N utilization substance protein B